MCKGIPGNRTHVCMCKCICSHPAPSRLAHVLNRGLCIRQYISYKHPDLEAFMEVKWSNLLLKAGPVQELDQVAKGLVQ